jgi:hypothetical protein
MKSDISEQRSGCLCPAKRTGRPGLSAQALECVRETFVRSPQTTTHHASRELQMPQSSVWRILRKRLLSKSTGCTRSTVSADGPVSQRPGSHSVRIFCTTHELFCPYVVLCCTWSETSVSPSQLTQFWLILRHRTLSYPLSLPCFVT